ncbi:protein lifeguard 1-like isoform X1 [Crotalus tigris]|uniref:protein lifeguard 1-like isoform X1 n=1 Tax=Crotalus tigris TaxID=88082 RepID=UPI00192F4F59|nr:protein lifeguard 1-like isoform X1 [Crotalus tigris]XP_039213630.1 protein lifeguard 1-like isoform X1 [Crotalus tigris]XP_039213631.1 protein lifeguard 1-like isoform X1 [Crotalus tigris]
MELPKMENNISLCGDIAYIKYQHPGGDSPDVPRTVKQFVKEDILPQSKERTIARETSSKFERVPSHVRRTKSSPSYGRRPRRGPSHRRRQHMVNVIEDSGPFADKAVRRTFLWKLYLMLAFQLGYTDAIICMFIYWKYLKIWVRRRPWFCYSLLPAILLIVIALACCDQARRKFPLNIILLALFTILMGTWLGSIDAFFDADTLMWTVGSTSLVTLGLHFFALQTKWQLTITNGILLVLLFSLTITGVLCIFMQSQLTVIFYSGVGTLLFGIYLLVDTQLMLGKKHHYRLNPDEYVFAVLNVYIDILNMFLFILRFVGFMK